MDPAGQRRRSGLRAALVWLPLRLWAFVPRRPEPLPEGPRFLSQGWSLEERRHVLLRRLTFSFFGLAIFSTSGVSGAASLLPDAWDTRPLLLTSLFVGLVSSGVCILFIHAHSRGGDRFLGVATRLTLLGTARPAQARDLLDETMWRHALGRRCRHLDEEGLEVALALAEEWEGSLASLLEAAPLLSAPLPADAAR